MQKAICDLCTDVFCPKRKVRNYKCNKFMTKEFQKVKDEQSEQITMLQNSLQNSHNINLEIIKSKDDLCTQLKENSEARSQQAEIIHSQKIDIEDFEMSMFYKLYKFFKI